ncbi:MAG: hypothetical protein WCG98_04115 [bacterium]
MRVNQPVVSSLPMIESLVTRQAMFDPKEVVPRPTLPLPAMNI